MISMGGEQMPPMDFPSDDEMGDVMNQENGEELPSDFDTNFDAGVEADEETDPKKYIQQLTGKLSQTLNSYNNENGEPDIELGKYVLGMIVKQGTKGMDEKDRKEIIKKINTSNSESDDDFEDEEIEMPEDNEMNNQGDENLDMKMESKTFKFTKKQIFENFGLATDVEKDDIIEKNKDTKISPDTVKNKKTRPFEAPKKFRE